MVLDLRSSDWWFNRHLLASIPVLLQSPMELPGELTRLESGYCSTQPDQSGGFYRGSVIVHGQKVAAGALTGGGPLLATVVDSRSGLALRLASGLQRAGLAPLLFTGSPIITGPSTRINAAPGLAVRIRTSEWINADGSFGFVPSSVAPIDEDRERLLQRAIALAENRCGVPIAMNLLGAPPYIRLQRRKEPCLPCPGEFLRCSNCTAWRSIFTPIRANRHLLWMMHWALHLWTPLPPRRQLITRLRYR